MNKSDIKLILFLFLISSLLFTYFKIINKSSGTEALVYYKNELVLTIDLNIDNKYQVNGDNGIVELEVKNKKVRVIKEKSPIHLCSKQGYISKSYETIICLPNKIVIKIKNNDSSLDTVVG